MKGLPLSYNRDLQEDKEPLFDALETVVQSLTLYAELVKRLHVRRDVLADTVNRGYLLATELADYLVKKGVPFREAHSIVGHLVQKCLKQKQELTDLSWENLRAISAHFTKDALQCLTLQSAIDRKAQVGGTARKHVARQLKNWEKRFQKKRI